MSSTVLSAEVTAISADATSASSASASIELIEKIAHAELLILARERCRLETEVARMKFKLSVIIETEYASKVKTVEDTAKDLFEKHSLTGDQCDRVNNAVLTAVGF